MKFTEASLENAFTELLGQEGFPHHLGIKGRFYFSDRYG
jgi:type I restriction enzyme R subunit